MMDGCDVRFILQTSKNTKRRGKSVGWNGQDWCFCDFVRFGLGGGFLALLAVDFEVILDEF